MRCAICDKDDENVTHFNTDCYECQEVIYDTLASYEPEEVIETDELELVDVDVETIVG